MDALGGEFKIHTHEFLKPDGINHGPFPLIAVGGGGRTTDVIHTHSQQGDPEAWQKFKFWADSATRQYYAFQTANGNFITANEGGGRITNTIFSVATDVRAWEMFKLLPQSPFSCWAIQTLKGYFLTAVGGGGHPNSADDGSDTIHTDALNVAEWERFDIWRGSDFGTGSTYAIHAITVTSGLLTATAGGRLSGLTGGWPPLVLDGGPPFWISWTLLKQSDGTYAFQTASGGILTANGGGLPGEGFRTDTETDQIGNWEKFTLVDNGDFTAYIKTHAGTYLSSSGGSPNTAIAVTDVSRAIKWQFQVLGL
jgi:hypothetical protein